MAKHPPNLRVPRSLWSRSRETPLEIDVVRLGHRAGRACRNEIDEVDDSSSVTHGTHRNHLGAPGMLILADDNLANPFDNPTALQIARSLARPTIFIVAHSTCLETCLESWQRLVQRVAQHARHPILFVLLGRSWIGSRGGVEVADLPEG